MENGAAKIIFFTETPFRQRDYERFGVAILSRRFQVEIYDCTAFLRPAFWKVHSALRFECPGYASVQTLSDLQDRLTGTGHHAVAIDFLFSGAAQDQIRLILREQGMRRMNFLVSPLPDARLRGLARARQYARRARNAALCVCHSLRAALYPAIPLPRNIAEVAVLGGRHSMRDPRSRTPGRVWAHHFDYDLYLALRERTGEAAVPYAVFLDQDFVNNTDRLITGTAAYVTRDRYYPSLNRFFSAFEAVAKMPVFIAAHPKSDPLFTDAVFEGRTAVRGESARLTRDASLVFAHNTAGLTFAVLWRKPIVLLTTDELRKSYLNTYIDAYRDELLVPMFNVDDYHAADINPAAWEKISSAAYDAFQENHIKVSGSPDRPLWEIIVDAVATNGARTND